MWKFLIYLLSPLIWANNVSYCVKEVTEKTLKYKQNENHPMLLASVSKLFTAHAVLKQLNPNETFKTQIKGKGHIRDNIFLGDLYLIGTGDPYLTAPHLVGLIDQLKGLGIKELKGNFYIDDSLYPLAKSVSDIGLEDQADNASFSALNLEFNRIKYFKNFQQTSPPLDYVQVKKVSKAGHGLIFKMSGQDAKAEKWHYHHREPTKHTEEIPIRDSSLFTGFFFQYLANLHQLKLPSPQRKKTPANAKVMATHFGLPIWRLVELGIEYSNNLMAEMLVKKTNTPLLPFLKKDLPQVDWSSTELETGSGLSLKNTTTAKTLCDYLSSVKSQSYKNKSFLSLLSINGHSGGLAKRINHPNLDYRVYGKTGSLHFVNNLAGYLIGNSGKNYAFAIFMTHEKNRKILSQTNSAKVNRVRKKHKNWHRQSTQAIDALVSTWIKKL